LPLSFPGIGQTHDRGDVARQQLFGDSIGECGAEHIADVLDGPVGKYLMAAGADDAAAAAIRGSGGIFALGAALAGRTQLVQTGADVADLEPVEPVGSETWDEIRAGEQGVPFGGLGCEVGLDDFAQPVGQVARQCRRGRWHRAFPGPCLELDPLLVHLVVGLAVDPLALPLAVGGRDPGVCGVSVAVGKDRGFPVAALAHATCCLIRRRI
jgi:hypothetical protein